MEQVREELSWRALRDDCIVVDFVLFSSTLPSAKLQKLGRGLQLRNTVKYNTDKHIAEKWLCGPSVAAA